ncbi:MAG: hypothetical protein ABSB74_11425 [Tepidisphaeraceae bacterium]|jgi:alanyl-tRNA synthetase
MKAGYYRALAAGIISVGFVASAALATAPSTQPSPTDQQLLNRINALEDEVHQLRAQQQQTQQQSQQQGPQKQETSGADSLLQVQTDADEHSQLLDTSGGFVGGWNPQKMQFYVGTDDGKFYFHPGVIMQFRYVEAYTNRPHDSTEGFEVR